ncbi:AmmeMemoRadiSam system protein A [Patescibacteria group bacterium]|nr:AmmeMemoRadiSam system protein A [Patescibacteria group bacterium]
MNAYILLAKSAVENYIKENKTINPAKDLPKDLLEKKAGVFVTIKKSGQLRGCIGTYLPAKENIAKEIIANAIAAAAKDYRFPPIQKNDLLFLSYEVYILSKPKPVKNIKDLDPKKYGLIIKSQPSVFSQKAKTALDSRLYSKTGLLLPDLEGIDTTEQQISIACQKGGIDPVKENILIYRFSAKRYE